MNVAYLPASEHHELLLVLVSRLPAAESRSGSTSRNTTTRATRSLISGCPWFTNAFLYVTSY
jgi:hypothetical protein